MTTTTQAPITQDTYIIKVRRGTNAERQGTIFELGEPVITTDTKQLYFGDGTTPGGFPVFTLPVGLLTAGMPITLLARGAIPKGKVLYVDTISGDIVGVDFPSQAITPPEFSYTTSSLTLAAGATMVITESLFSNRLYGKLVGVLGLQIGQKVKVSFYGNTTNTGTVDLTDNQYQSEFTDLLPTDARQLWVYRDRKGEKILRVLLENTGTDSVTFQLVVKGEPI